MITIKTLSAVLGLFLSFAVVLAACSNGSSQASTPETNTPPSFNPSNTFTAATDDYIFILQDNAIHRMHKNGSEITELIRAPLGNGIAVFDDYIYFMTPTGISRANTQGEHITEVVATGQSVYQLYSYDGYLIAHTFYMSGEYEPKNTFRIFIPDTADTLEEISPADFGEERLAVLQQTLTPKTNDEYDTLWHKLFPDALEIIFGDYIRTPEGYYLIGLGGALYSAPLDLEELQEVPISEDSQQFQGCINGHIVNYDSEWLYIQAQYGISRVHKYGGTIESLVEGGVQSNQPIDVVGGNVIYKGTDGVIYMNRVALIDPAPDSGSKSLDATVLELSYQLFICPNSEPDRILFGDRVELDPASGAELVDLEGNRVWFEDLKPGATVTIHYGSHLEREGKTSLTDVTKIVIHMKGHT